MVMASPGKSALRRGGHTRPYGWRVRLAEPLQLAALRAAAERLCGSRAGVGG